MDLTMAEGNGSRDVLEHQGRPGISFASITGALFGIALVVGAIMLATKNYFAFLSIHGFMIVMGGTLTVAFMSFQANYVMDALKAIGLMFRKALATHENLHHDMINIMSWARVVKDKGLRGLESKARDAVAHDPFISYGLDMVVSNYTAEDVRAMMETAAEAYYKRDTTAARVLLAMASHAPAFGMVGTLIGMVVMLGDFDGDMSGIAKGLAVALLATLYGLLSARMVFMPAAAKLMQKQENLKFRNHLITEGMVMLVAGKTPHHIEDRLSSFLKPGLYQAHLAKLQD